MTSLSGNNRQNFSYREGDTQGNYAKRVAITIPTTTGNASLISTLASLTADEIARLVSCKIHTYRANSTTARDGFFASDSAATRTNDQYVASGDAYYEPAAFDANNTYVISSGTSTVAALAIFTLSSAT